MSLHFKKLSNFSVGETLVIVGYDQTNQIIHRKKLLSLGLTRGTTLQIIRVAPLGDPIEIKLRGFSLVLRKNEADTILVEKIM